MYYRIGILAYSFAIEWYAYTNWFTLSEVLERLPLMKGDYIVEIRL